MRRLFIASLQFSFAFAAGPTVTNVRAAQKAGTKQVEIYYDVSGANSPVFISLQVSADGGTNFPVPANTLIGHVGAGVSLGKNRIITWNAGVDWNNQLSNTVKFRVTASVTPPVTAELALIPAGSFQMGDQSNPVVGSGNERPIRSVSVSAFYMGKYEVTKELWDQVRSWGLSNGYTDLPVGNDTYASKGANHPVHNINWYAVVKWCNARSQKENLMPCYTVSGSIYKTGNSSPECNWNTNGYRMPTEAEWEKAARGGVAGKNFPWGTDTISQSEANYYAANTHPTYSVGAPPYSSPVGSFAPNGYGLYDMAGNMWEWCWDWYGSYTAGSQTDPHGAVSGSERVVRGGSWLFNANLCRAAFRGYLIPPESEFNFGFRIARSLVP